MRVTTLLRAVLAAALLSTAAGAQRSGGDRNANGTNPQLDLPYGATSAAPASKWTPPPSAGRQLTLRDLLSWKTIRSAELSNDGNWFAYVLAPNEGDAEVVIRGTAAGAQEMRFPVGDASGGGRGGRGGGGGALAISGNSRWVAFMEYASSANAGGRGRGGRGGAGGAAGRAAPKLAVVSLADGSRREFESVRSFRFAGDTSNWLAIQHAPEGAAPAEAGAPAAGRGAGAAGGGNGGASVLELVDLAGGTPVPIANVSEFAFNDGGDWVAYAISENDRVGNSVQVRQLATGITRPLDVQKATYRRLVWADSSHALAVIRSVSDSAADERSTLLAWTDITARDAQPIDVDATTAGVAGGLVVSSDRSPQWGDGRKLLFFGLREPRPPRTPNGGFRPPSPGGVAPGAGNTGQVAAAPQTDADVPSLILWHWKDPRTQSTQQVQEAQDRAFNYLASYDLDAGHVVQLADDRMRSVAIGPKATWGIGEDDTDYARAASIRGFDYRDLYAVNLATGERKPVQKKVPGGGGRGGFGASNFSPDNARYAYYDTGDWKVYDFASGATKTVTRGVPARFWNTEDDHNQVKPPIGGGFIGWSKDNGSVLVRDNWDVWRIPVDGGPAINLTGNGQKDQVRYQSREIFDPRDRSGIDLSQPMYFETYGEWTKKEGLSKVDPLRGGATRVTWEDAKVDYRRARDADTWVFTRQTVARFPDWYAAGDGITNERRLTDANPQQKDVAWSAGAVLIDYTCDNGLGRHQAALFLPAGYEKGKRYPTLTYIYEKLSQGFHVYPVPNATRYSNPAVYTSRGYAFLQPDIVYKVNDPGRSAVWCVVPAVKAAIAAGYVDPGRVGLQGHSWGGYQTTFITTQTKIFRTAVAGAPLTDMTSMFGSIYWNSGNTDGSIFIASQGRFTGGPNEIPQVYARNSPQTFAQNLSIPFMILSNDRDGAVDFNQGVTYYNHLRTLDKDVILLEYVGENHGLARPANQKDYALRMTEWFDTFLRDEPAPDWITNGVPRLKMAEHLKARRAMVDEKAARPAAPIVP